MIYWWICQIKTKITSKTRAIIPAAIGDEAEVPVWDEVHLDFSFSHVIGDICQMLARFQWDIGVRAVRCWWYQGSESTIHSGLLSSSSSTNTVQVQIQHQWLFKTNLPFRFVVIKCKYKYNINDYSNQPSVQVCCDHLPLTGPERILLSKEWKDR